MTSVVSREDIVTDNNFTVARAGDVGVPLRPEAGRPASGKVLVRFRGRRRAYWCPAGQLEFRNGVAEDWLSPGPVLRPEPAALPSAGPRRFHFGRNLRLFRESRGLSQAALGARMGGCGVPAVQSTICYREKNRHCPGGRFVEAAAAALDVPVPALFMPLDDAPAYGDLQRFLQEASGTLCPEVRPAVRFRPAGSGDIDI